MNCNAHCCGMEVKMKNKSSRFRFCSNARPCLLHGGWWWFLRQRMGKWGIFHVGVGLLVPSNQFRQSSRKFSPVKGELRWKFRFERFSQIGQSNIFSLSTSWLWPLFTDTGQPRNVEHLFHKICSLWLLRLKNLVWGRNSLVSHSLDVNVPTKGKHFV